MSVRINFGTLEPFIPSASTTMQWFSSMVSCLGSSCRGFGCSLNDTGATVDSVQVTARIQEEEHANGGEADRRPLESNVKRSRLDAKPRRRNRTRTRTREGRRGQGQVDDGLTQVTATYVGSEDGFNTWIPLNHLRWPCQSLVRCACRRPGWSRRRRKLWRHHTCTNVSLC